MAKITEIVALKANITDLSTETSARTIADSELDTKIGNLNSLTTNVKDNTVLAINDLKNAVDLNTAKVSNIDHPLVETAVPADAVFTDTNDNTTYTLSTDNVTTNAGNGTITLTDSASTEQTVSVKGFKEITITGTSVSDGTNTFNQYDDASVTGRLDTIEALSLQTITYDTYTLTASDKTNGSVSITVQLSASNVTTDISNNLKVYIGGLKIQNSVVATNSVYTTDTSYVITIDISSAKYVENDIVEIERIVFA